ncbi:MAG: hypothetical protein U0R72_12415 [Nakamurella multipartita]
MAMANAIAPIQSSAMCDWSALVCLKNSSSAAVTTSTSVALIAVCSTETRPTWACSSEVDIRSTALTAARPPRKPRTAVVTRKTTAMGEPSRSLPRALPAVTAAAMIAPTVRMNGLDRRAVSTGADRVPSNAQKVPIV